MATHIDNLRVLIDKVKSSSGGNPKQPHLTFMLYGYTLLMLAVLASFHSYSISGGHINEIVRLTVFLSFTLVALPFLFAVLACTVDAVYAVDKMFCVSNRRFRHTFSWLTVKTKLVLFESLYHVFKWLYVVIYILHFLGQLVMFSFRVVRGVWLIRFTIFNCTILLVLCFYSAFLAAFWAYRIRQKKLRELYRLRRHFYDYEKRHIPQLPVVHGGVDKTKKSSKPPAKPAAKADDVPKKKFNKGFKGGKSAKRRVAVPRDRKGFIDKVTDDVRLVNMKDRMINRTEGHSHVLSSPFVFETSDPRWDFYDPVAKQAWRVDAADIDYIVATMQCDEYPVTKDKCFFNCVFSIYIGTLHITTKEDFEAAHTTFNSALFRVTSLVVRGGGERASTHEAFLAGKTYFSSDVLFDLCTELKIKIYMVCTSEDPSTRETVVRAGVLGHVNVVRGCVFPDSVAGVMMNEIHPALHFALVDGIILKPETDLNADFGEYRVIDFVYSFMTPVKKSRYFAVKKLDAKAEEALKGMPAYRRIARDLIVGNIAKMEKKSRSPLVSKEMEKSSEDAKTRFELQANKQRPDETPTTQNQKSVEKVQPTLPHTEETKEEPVAKAESLSTDQVKPEVETKVCENQESKAKIDEQLEEKKDETPIDLTEFSKELKDILPMVDDSSSSDDGFGLFDDDADDEKVIAKEEQKREIVTNCPLGLEIRELEALCPADGNYRDVTRVEREKFLESVCNEQVIKQDVEVKLEESEEDIPIVKASLDDFGSSESEDFCEDGSGTEDSSEDSSINRSKSEPLEICGRVYWQQRTHRPLLSLEDDSVNPCFALLIDFLGDTTGRALWRSRICRSFMELKNKRNDKWFPRLRGKLHLLKEALSGHYDEFLTVFKGIRRDYDSEFYLIENPLFYDDHMGAGYGRNTVENSFHWNYWTTTKNKECYDYALSVNQLHKESVLFVGRKTEYKEFNCETESGLLALLHEVSLNWQPTIIPRIYAGKDGYKRIKGFLIKKFSDLTTLETLLFLGSFASAYKVLKSEFVFDMEMVVQLNSPKVFSGCTSYTAICDRIDTVAASTLAKFNMRKCQQYFGVNIAHNSIEAAKCIGKSIVEKTIGEQCIDKLPKTLSERIKEGITKHDDAAIRLVYGAKDPIYYDDYDDDCVVVNYVTRKIAGYRTVEKQDMPALDPVVRNFSLQKLDKMRPSDTVERKLVAVTSYNCYDNLAPIADGNDAMNIREGLTKRIGSAVPEPGLSFKILFPEFVKFWVHKNGLYGSIVELLIEEVEQMKDWEKYRLTLRYDPARQRELDKIRKEVDQLGTFDFADTDEGNFYRALWTKVEAHVKWESYHGEIKYVRMIFARVDHFKVMFGPYAKLTQKAAYRKLPYFVTDKPVRSLPSFLQDSLRLYDLVFGTDFSRFESHNYPWFMLHCPIYIVLCMWGHEIDKELEVSMFALFGTNVIENTYVSCLVDGKMMSGEVWTTLFNTFTNICVISYILEAEGLIYGIGFFFDASNYSLGFVGLRLPAKTIDFRMYNAGDDGIFGLTKLPGVDYSKYSGKKGADYLKAYGVELKIEQKTSLGGAGFLSKYYGEFDVATLCDPLKQLSKGILPPKYAFAGIGLKKSLSRARAMSLLYEFGSCPIVASYARCILRCTRNINIKPALVHFQRDDPFKFDQIKEAVDWYDTIDKTAVESIGMESRLIIEDNFGIPICTQEVIERYFDRVNDTSYPIEFKVPCLDLITPEANSQFFRDYAVEYDHLTDRSMKVCLSYLPERDVLDQPKARVATSWFDLVSAYAVCVPIAAAAAAT